MTDILTSEEGVSLLLSATEPKPEAEEAPEAVKNIEAEEVETGEGGEPEAGDEEQEEAAAEPVAAPEKWDAEDKAWFAEQPPEVQSKILEQETKREAVLAKARAKATEEAREAVSKESEQVVAVAKALQEFLPKAAATFNQRWGEPDWKATLEQYGSEATHRLQIEYQEQQQELRRLVEAQEQASAIARQQHVVEESKKLAELAPELAADATMQKEVAAYLLSNGATNDDLDNIPAWAAVLALKAHRYDKAQAAAKAPKPPTPARPVLKPAAGQATTSTQRTATQLKNRLAQTGSREDAVALLLQGN